MAPAGRPSNRTLEILEELVAQRTSSDSGNLEIIDYIESLLAPLRAELIRTYDESGSKTNLLARLGPNHGAGVILSGHTDVVPVSGQEWSFDPWALTEDGDRLYGRGSCDMKGFLACMLSVVERMDVSTLSSPLYLAFSYDEEIGLRGVRPLIEDFNGRGLEAALCVVGEPTEMQVAVGHKSILQGTCTVTGSEAHSSLEPHAANALYGAARVLTRLEEMEREREENGPFDPGYGVPHSTVHAATIRSGVALNIVPRTAEFGFEFRCIPGEDPRTLLEDVREFTETQVVPRLRRTAPEADVRFRVAMEGPGLDTASDSPEARRAMRATGVEKAAPPRMPFATEAGLFQRAGIPTVLCGPGDIAQAHKPDEYVTLEQLARCEAFLTRLLSED